MKSQYKRGTQVQEPISGTQLCNSNSFSERDDTEIEKYRNLKRMNDSNLTIRVHLQYSIFKIKTSCEILEENLKTQFTYAIIKGVSVSDLFVSPSRSSR